MGGGGGGTIEGETTVLVGAEADGSKTGKREEKERTQKEKKESKGKKERLSYSLRRKK